MTFTVPVIRELLRNSVKQRKKLEEAYTLLPPTQCQRKTQCCSLLPDMTLLEALTAIHHLARMPSIMRKKLTKKMISYFILNPVEITSCPFLNYRDCLVYQNRFFGCRAYGLWSHGYYEKIASNNREVKRHFQKQWQKLGVSLPQAVIDFQVPYCMCVKVDRETMINDEMLLHVADTMTALSEQFLEWHQLFSQWYFSDLSFLLASLAFGFKDAVTIKFSIVREVVVTGNRSRLETISEQLPDICAEFTG
jgi:Fe-S-cluster containining protein